VDGSAVHAFNSKSSATMRALERVGGKPPTLPDFNMKEPGCNTTSA
jgi:hypothetical protein